MKVSTAEPFQIIYSLYSHQYLGPLFESFVVQLDAKGELTFKHQNISSKNAAEFASGLDDTDYELIKQMDSIQQDVILNKFYNKKISPADFFLKVYDKEKGDKLLQDTIAAYIERRKADILSNMYDRHLYIMGKDGEPAWKKVTVPKEKASVLFHFFKNEDNTHYFPTIKHEGKKIEFQFNESRILCKEPAWLLVDDILYTFKKEVDGNKLKPFLNKKFIVIPQTVEEKYYNTFVAPLVANFDVFAKGFDINTVSYDAQPVLTFAELATNNPSPGLFDDNKKEENSDEQGKLVFDLTFNYGSYNFSPNGGKSTSVKVEKNNGSYVFNRIKRQPEWEKEQIKELGELGIQLKNGKAVVKKTEAFQWLAVYEDMLKEKGYEIRQNPFDKKKYFLGKHSISIEIKEKNDWFDIYAIVKFGEFEIPFLTLKNLVLAKKTEFTLPNGEIAVIPDNWVTDYAEIFAFSEGDKEGGNLKLKRHHVALIQELQNGNLAQVTMDRKLQKLRNFDEIEDYPLPKGFKGKLRPYQKAGYNWLQFLQEYNLGGCLADDMGLGKTVQTLTLLQDQKEKGAKAASLLVMPTSLVYNWEMEAKKFVPDLKVFTYTGTNRDKDVSKFNDYDVILTSYGIIRLDIELLKDYYFNYIILDESQAIKNPSSNIASAIKEMSSTYKLILTGTPIENSTMDLWSQMSFANPGLLGTQAYFKNEFQIPIEKRSDEKKTERLYAIIKPFILRRKKSQVVTELPEKVEQVYYCEMTPEQEEEYEKVKSHYRNEILRNIDQKGRNKSQLILLQGLTKLRQIANHPKMVDEDFDGESGKMKEVLEMLESAISKKHKILIFSQFVKHLNIIREHLDAQGLDYAYLDGSTKARKSQVEMFQNNEDIRTFLISLKAGGLGLNLTAADYVFILDPWWNPAIEAQAVDRAHRIGQKNKVFNYKFITRNTVEEKILVLQQNKKKLADGLITTEESFIKSLSNQDIEALLQ